MVRYIQYFVGGAARWMCDEIRKERNMLRVVMLATTLPALSALRPLMASVPGRQLARSAIMTRTTSVAMAELLPSSPKELAQQMSLSVQAALADKHRKLEVKLPSGLCFGLFGQPPGKQMLGSPDAMIPAPVQERSSRELAFLFVEIFQTYKEACVVCFPNARAADAAEKEWARSQLSPRIVASLDELAKRPAAGFGKSKSMGSTRGAAVQPQILLLVEPTVAQVKAATIPDGGVIVLLNPSKQNAKRGYEMVYTLVDNPHPDWKGGLLFRSYPGQWTLGVSAKVGPPRIHGRSTARPSLVEIDAGFEKVKSDKGLLSQAGGVLSAAGAAAGLERRGS